MDRKNKIILAITVVSLILAINIHQVKKRFMYQNIARSVFLAAGVPVSEYAAGINFFKPVKIYPVKKGDIFIQYQVPAAPQGGFYGLQESTPSELGINEMGLDPKTKSIVKKERRIYVAIKDFNALSSYAASVKDNWSTPEDESRTQGKHQQFFTICKPCFERIYEEKDNGG